MQKRNITYSSDRSSLLDELLLLFWGKSSLYQLVFFQKRTVCSPQALFVVGRLHEHAAHVVIYIWMRGGGIALEIMGLDWKDWTSCWFHTDYFITECLFSTRLTSFESRHFELSIDITPMSVCWVFAELQFILVTYFKEQFAETEKTESASCWFSFVFQNHKDLLLLWVYTQKSRHLTVSIDV